ncbi:MAG TPA: xanthine dehydrogenase small subunit [Nannocystaceae bacterium]|nr:xanthine dehydrogenase small subunit [Nannocystaceae bacterium]
MQPIRFYLNDRLIEDREVAPTTTLLDYLRQHAHLAGTKEGCAEGDCGACSVAILDAEAPGGPRFRAINACLVLLPMVQGQRVYTVEGLKTGAALHPVQEALAEAIGSQCGYCTPGVVMSMFEACYRGDLAEPWQLDDQMCGNLCRCTGYRPIREATAKVAGSLPADRFRARLEGATAGARGFAQVREGQVFVTPSSLEELWAAMAAHPEARLLCGGTDLALTLTKRFEALPLLISLEGIAALRGVSGDGARGWRIGATTLLADLEAASAAELVPLHRMLRYFASRQIKNRATVGGNLCNASPIGDLAPVLLALGATVEVASTAGVREVGLDAFFVGYRRTALAKGEILAAVRVPPLAKGALASAYKVSKRRELDISAVAAGFYVELDDEGRVAVIRAGFGGMAATPSRARHLEAALLGRPWSEASMEAAVGELGRDFAPIGDHRGSSWYRQTVAANLVRGFFFETRGDPRPRLPQRPSSTVALEVLP